MVSEIDSSIHQRVQSLYGTRKPAPVITTEFRSLSGNADDEAYSSPSGIAARMEGVLTVDDGFAVEKRGNKRVSSSGTRLGDEDFAPEQFLNRSSPRNLSWRGSIRSHRSGRNNDDPQPRSTSNQRRTEQGQTSVMLTTVMDMSGNGTNPGAQNRALPVPELKHTESGSPYYSATPNPALLTPFHQNEIGKAASTPRGPEFGVL